MKDRKPKVAAVIVAHPDDETLWAGGTIISHPSWKWFIISLTRKSDADRSPKFFKALNILSASGTMGDLDDGPEVEETRELWIFAYEDGGKQFLPRAVKTEALYKVLPEKTWRKKYAIIKDTFGFNEKSWEADTTPREESFRKFTNSGVAMQWMLNIEKQ